MHKSPVFHFGWSACPSVSLTYTGCDYRVVIRDQWLASNARQHNEYPSSLAALPSTHSHAFPSSLSASHSARFSYNNILIPLIHATLAAKPNKLKAAARARRLRGLLNVARCCCCCCCWTLPAFRRAQFLGFSHLLTPPPACCPGFMAESGSAWALPVCVNH